MNRWIRRPVCIAAVCGMVLGSAIAQEVGAGAAHGLAPTSAPAAQSSPAVIVLKDLRIDRANRQVVVASQVCLQPGPLEVLLCKWGTKDYESVLRTKAEPSSIHAALLALGLTAGKAACVTEPSDDKPSKVLPPRGAALEITLRWKAADGKVKEVPAGQWLRGSGPHAAAGPKEWIFVGSDTHADGRYWADDDGDIIAVANIGAAVIDVPVPSPRDYSRLEFVANEKAVPPPGTDVDVVIAVPTQSLTAPDARVVVDLDPSGDAWLEGKRLGDDALTDWGRQYISRHARGLVVLRAQVGCLACDVQRVRQQLQLGGVALFQEQPLLPYDSLPPRNALQSQESLARWHEKLNGPDPLVAAPADEAREELESIRREIGALRGRQALLEEYSRRLAQELQHYAASTRPADANRP